MKTIQTSVLIALFTVTPVSGQESAKPQATHKDVPYGPHSRMILDFWLARPGTQTPLAVYIHGGGFTGGSKDSLNVRTLSALLESGISVAAIEYRLIQDRPLPAAHYDAKRAIQFLRSRALEWGIDKNRIGAFGGSAGAQLCMWLGFHDDMANPDSSDPLEHESTRLSCLATTGGQITRDFGWWERNIPGYVTHRDPYQDFGAKTKEELLRGIEETSVINHLTADDPPIFMSYRMAPDDPIPSDPTKASGWKVHHVVFGVTLKNRMEELGIEAELKYPGVKAKYPSIAEFFRLKLE